jgi:hypothetical protein
LAERSESIQKRGHNHNVEFIAVRYSLSEHGGSAFTGTRANRLSRFSVPAGYAGICMVGAAASSGILL